MKLLLEGQSVMSILTTEFTENSSAFSVVSK
jgi:hypothetical protein